MDAQLKLAEAREERNRLEAERADFLARPRPAQEPFPAARSVLDWLPLYFGPEPFPASRSVLD